MSPPIYVYYGLKCVHQRCTSLSLSLSLSLSPGTFCFSRRSADCCLPVLCVLSYWLEWGGTCLVSPVSPKRQWMDIYTYICSQQSYCVIYQYHGYILTSSSFFSTCLGLKIATAGAGTGFFGFRDYYQNERKYFASRDRFGEHSSIFLSLWLYPSLFLYPNNKPNQLLVHSHYLFTFIHMQALNPTYNMIPHLLSSSLSSCYILHCSTLNETDVYTVVFLNVCSNQLLGLNLDAPKLCVSYHLLYD